MSQTNKTNKYIVEKWGERTQIELAKAIAEAKGETHPKAYESYKGYVNKWFNTNQEPGKDYLLILSKILNVSIESILMGEDVINQYGDRATAYSAAISGDENVIKQLFGNKEADIWLHTEDEYGKSFVDYVVEYKNYVAFKKTIKMGYGYPLKTTNQLEFDVDEPKDVELLRMLIEADDEEMFIKAFPYGWTTFFENADIRKNRCMSLKPWSYVVLPNSLCKSILEAPTILKIFMQSRPFTDKEWAVPNRDIEFINEEDEILVRKIPSLSPIFNYLLDCAIKNNMNDVLMELLTVAEKHVEAVKKILATKLKEFEIKLEYDCMIVFKNARRGLYGFMPYVKNIDLINDEKLKEKALNINELIDKIGRK